MPFLSFGGTLSISRVTTAKGVALRISFFFGLLWLNVDNWWLTIWGGGLPKTTPSGLGKGRLERASQKGSSCKKAGNYGLMDDHKAYITMYTDCVILKVISFFIG